MKKIAWITLLFILAVVGLYYANTYTSAMVENPVFLSVSNPDGLITLIPKENLTAEQGSTVEDALTLRNNMKVEIYNLRFECSNQYVTPVLKNDELAPGSKTEISLAVDSKCPASEQPLELEVTLFAEFEGGRAKIKTTFPLTVSAPLLVESNMEDDGDENEGEKTDPGAGPQMAPSVPSDEPPNGSGEESTNGYNSESEGNSGDGNPGEGSELNNAGSQGNSGNNTGDGSEVNNEDKTDEGPTDHQEGL